MKASTLNTLLVAAAAVAAVAVLASVKSPPTRPTPGPAPQRPPQPLLSPAREAVAQAALSQVGNGDPKRYWDDVLPGAHVGKAD